jgi:hypothetical protein
LFFIEMGVLLAVDALTTTAARWCNLRRGGVVSTPENAMRSLPTSSQLIDPQQNKAGLIADLVIVVLFLVLLAVR